MQGTMLWFNEVKDCGVILTEEGERLSVPGDGFAGGMRPKGRCAKAAVSFEVVETKGERTANEVVLVPEASQRRARLRRRAAR
jgi:cold shock CspA family protein